MDQRELEEFEQELRVLQYRVEQSIRFFFQNQRTLFLENVRSINDLRTSLENTVISGTGNSNNHWQIYLVEEPVEFNWFQYLCMAFLVWLIIVVFHIIRKCNEPSREPCNSRYIRCEPINVDLSPANNIENDRRSNDNEPSDELLPPASNGNQNENNCQSIKNQQNNRDETDGQGYENSPISVLPPNNDNPEGISGQGNGNPPINVLPSNIDNQDEISGQGNENSPINVLPPVDDNQDGINGQGDEIPPIHVLPPNIDNQDEISGQGIENPPINVLPPDDDNQDGINGQGDEIPPIHVLQPNIDNQDEISGQGIENPPINVLPPDDDNQDGINGQGDEIPPIHVLQPNIDNQDEISGQGIENPPINVLPPVDDNRDGINGQGDEIPPIHVLPPNIDSQDEIRGQGIENPPINVLPPVDDNRDGINGQGDEIPPIHVLPPNIDNQEEIRGQGNEIPPIHVLPPNIDNQGGINGQGNEIPPIHVLPPNIDNHDETNGQGNGSLPINPLLLQQNNYNEDEPNGHGNGNQPSDVLLLPCNNDNGDETNCQENGTNQISVLLPPLNNVNKEETNSEQRKDKLINEMKEIFKYGLHKMEQLERDTVKETDTTQKENHNRGETTKKDIAEKSEPLPCGSKTREIETPDQRKDAANQTEDGVKLEKIEKISTNGSANGHQKESGSSSCGEATKSKKTSGHKTDLIKESVPLLSYNKINDSAKSENATAIKVSDHPPNVVVKTDNENKEAIKSDSKNDSIKEDQEKSKCSSSVVLNNEAVKNLKGNLNETNAIEKLGEDKNTDSKPNESDVTVESSTLPSEIESGADKVLKSEDKERKVSVENDSKESLPTSDPEEPADSTSKGTLNEGVKNTKENTTEGIATENKNEDNKEDKDNVEKPKDSNTIEESTKLSSESKTSDLPKSQNVVATKTSDQHAGEDLKTKDNENKDSVQGDSKDGLTTSNQENSQDLSSVAVNNEDAKEEVENNMETNAIEKLSEHKNDDNKQDGCNLEKGNEVENIEESKTLPSENKITDSPKSQNATTTEISDDHKDEVIKTEDEKQKGSIERDSINGLVSKDQEEPKDASITVVNNDDVRNVIENNMEANVKCKEDEGDLKINEEKPDDTDQSETLPLENETKISPKSQNAIAIETSDHIDELIEKYSKGNLAIQDQGDQDQKSGDIDQSKTLLSENKTSNSPKSQNVIISNTSESNSDEVVKTENEEKKDSIEKDSKDGLKNEDQEESIDLSSVVVKKEDVENAPENNINTNTTEQLDGNKTEDKKETEVTLLEKESDVGNTEKSVKNVTETSDSHKDEVVKTEDEEKKTEDMENALENKMEGNATEVLSENKIAGNIEDKSDLEKETEIGNIEESVTLTSKTSNSPKSQETPNSHTDEVVKTEDEEKKDLVENHVEGGIVNEDQEMSTSSATEKLSGNKNDDGKGDVSAVQKESEVDNIEEIKTLPSENISSTSPKAQIVSATETFDHQTDEVVKTEDVINNSLEKDTKDGLISENQELKDFPENNKNASGNKIDEGNENLDDAEKVPKADTIEKLTILPSESQISNSSESENFTAAETPDQHIDEIIKADGEETKEKIEKDSINTLMNKDQKESESTSLDVVDNNLEASKTEKLSEEKTGDNMEDKDGVQHVTEADIIEESERLPSETSTLEHQEEEIVKNENAEKELEKIAEKSETNAVDEENKKIQSEDSKEGLSNENKISTENEATVEQNKEEKIEINSNIVEAASESIEAETNAPTNALNENEMKDKKSEEESIEESCRLERSDEQNQETASEVVPSCSDSDTENQATSSTPNNSSSGNDQFLGGQRRNQKKKKGKKSKHNRY